MGKIKVYELSKELNVQSKDIINYLQEKGIEGKVAQSALEDSDVVLVKRKFGAKESAKASAEPSKEPVSKEAAESPEAPKKKKRIVIVGNPQNSKSGMSMPQQRPQQKSQPRPQQERTQERPQQKPQQKPQPKQETKSDISAEQMKAKFNAILGEGKQQTPANPAPAAKQEPVAQTPVGTNTAASTVSSVASITANMPTVNIVSRGNVVHNKKTEAAAENSRQNNASAEGRNDNRENRQSGYNNERRNENRGENRQGGYNNDRRNENRGENRQSGYNNDRRNENRGENRQGGYNNERRNENRGENRQGGYNNDRRSENGGGFNRDNRQGGYNNDRRNENGGSFNRDNRQGGYNNDRRNENGGSFNRDNRQGGFGGDRRNDNRGENRQGGFGGRPVFDKDKDEVQTRPGQGGKKQSGSRNSGGGFADVAPAKDNKRDERRASGQEKDRKNKKDYIYEEENTNLKGKNANKAGKFIKPEKKVEDVEEQIKVIQLPETITLKDLADKMRMQPSAIIKKLFMQGKIVTVNHELNYEEAEEIAMDYDILCEKEERVDVIEELLKEEDESEDDLITRPPVICVMGHVDHGKTSLLDAIRKTHVTDKEAGGITQHIGAYTVKVPSGESITFLDTPGHEAFTAMRMRGANSTDIAILVVAADDGVMPQTVEAINHAKAAGIEIIVAVNKIDKPAANIERVKQELTEYGLIAEDWGGSTVFCPVSAKKGEGIEELLEMILLTADVLELKANPKRQARGLVIEAQLDKGRGPVATVLVQKGTLHVGDFISAGACYGKVRAMIDDKGHRVKEAGPSTPVEILGLSDVPEAGEVFLSHDSDKTAKTYAETYMAEYKARMLEETKKRMSLDDLFGQIQAGNLKELNIIVKADVQGSVEAVKQSLTKLSNEEVVVKCIHGGVGLINESDVVLASASNAIIIGFNSRPDATAKATAEREGVEIKLYRVIYQAIEDIERAMKGMLDPIFEEKVIGHAEVRQIFKASAVGNIAGSYVLDGVFQRGCKVRISREGKQIFEGELASLKRFKDDVKEVKAGYECGLVFAGFDQMQELDIVEAYTMVEVPR